MNFKPNIPSVITATLSGLAGGAALLSFLGPIGTIGGSILGAAITGYAEYKSEKNIPDNNIKNGISNSSNQLHAQA
jgi:hypothetical protein